MSQGIILTCRLKSTRLPLKAIRKINNKEFIIHVFDRLRKLNLPIVLATTHNSEDDIICDLAKFKNINVYRGEEIDVLSRIYKASKKYQVLECYEESPQLPFGYPTSMVIALIPPLWFSIMNKRVPNEMISL